MKKKYNVLSLFTGAGGLDIGFEEVGFKIVLASDIWSESEKTFKHNFPETPFLCEDIKTITAKKILKKTNKIYPEIIIGGPPCQGFSVMGDKNSGDPRNYLFESYVKLVKELKPLCFIFENVKGLKTMFSGKYYIDVINSFSNLGYNVYDKILNSKDFGVPQSRERVIIVGTRLDNLFQFPRNNSKKIGKLIPKKNSGEAINDLITKGSEIPNHISLNHSETVIRRYKLIKPGGKLPPPEKLPADIRRSNFGNTYVRLDANAVAPTMVPGNNAFPIHPSLHRSLTPREAARIQSFPDDFVFTGPRKEQCKLVGNAVPPLLGASIALKILDHLNGKISKSNDTFIPKFTSISKKLKKDNVSKTNLTCVDLFSGIGGISIGFEKAGFKTLFGADFDESVSKTHKHNFPNIDFINSDLSKKKTFEQIKKKYSKKNLTILVGGPPCQGFSIYGKRRFINSKSYNPHSDKRNKLVFTFLNYAKLLKPEWIMMENVPGIVNLDDGYFINILLKNINKLGYKNCEYKIINTADYGVPQKRKRFILLANRLGLTIPWPKPKYFENPKDWQLPYRSIKEVISDLDKIKSYDDFHNHIPMKHAKDVIKRFSYIKEGKKLEPNDLPKNLQYSKLGNKIKSYSKVFFRLDRNLPSPTLVPGHSAFPIHPSLNRQLTIREAARIQTFPDDFKILGGSGDQCKQVGNAFPPLAAEVFANFIRKAIDNKWTDNNISNLAKYSLVDKSHNN